MLLNPIFLSCEGVVIWRGHFVSSPNIDGVTLTINGGQGE